MVVEYFKSIHPTGSCGEIEISIEYGPYCRDPKCDGWGAFYDVGSLGVFVSMNLICGGGGSEVVVSNSFGLL